MLIDSHVHVGGPDRGDGATLGPEELISEMNRLGVEQVVVFPL
jgi:hypothetical protein